MFKKLVLLSSIIAPALGQSLKLANNYTGSTFFDRWTFQNGIDANTTGNVLFQTQSQATSLGLIGTNAAGNVIIKVDNTTSGAGNPTFGRPSVKILSNDSVPMGSLVIMDAVHMPFGCSVWPAFWMQGPNWPNDGEIDIVENVNLVTTNRYTLHSLNGCMHPPAGSSLVQETGQVISTDCFNQTNGDEGCIVQDPSTNSYGKGFASVGGGVFAMLWNDEGIRTWFFQRGSIPADVPTSNPNPAGWPTPTAFWPTATCNTSQFFSPQTIIFDITICGNFAGAPQVFSETCSGNCLDLVQDPTNYDDAYFEIKYVAVFTNSSEASSSTTSGSSSTSTGSGSSPSGSGSGSSSAALGFKSYLTLTPSSIGVLSMAVAIVLPALAVFSGAL
ncbi:hypothetical protein SISSUDRAFT_1009421 [Sistotremastrum suecicum HHB10207 ss-3]|uniref:GH16 domain-containing protein n=1 Tax=Sistotremastrum suecicum HHB10207 ss-3 TaxID=1314776 RepID=A0A166A1R3_9AGAM|nr:hypothetical protein SISSUDRAFT_1009421 [Sistotremastrum suecicum HHB10207 ss-3]